MLVRIAIALVVLSRLGSAQTTPDIRFNEDAARPSFSVVDWAGAAASSVPAESGDSRWRSVFAVFVDGGDAGVPPLSGSYRLEDGVLIFEPRYPLQAGLRYRAVLRPSDEQGGEPLVETFAIPEPELGPATFVEQVYPTASMLPENLLKFYLHFSAPMSRGEAYQRVSLLAEDGTKISLPFLELDQELWDPEGRRLTLLFDPGRVKRDLLPNQEVGSPLREGGRFTLVIDEGWPDADGRPLKEEFRKSFQVGPPDHEPPSEKKWNVGAPSAGARDTLTVRFAESLDQALLMRVIEVATATGDRIAGAVEVADHEMVWRFRPETPWAAGEYVIDVATILEDLAGNSLERPFEVDVFERVEDRVERVSRRVPFRVE